MTQTTTFDPAPPIASELSLPQHCVQAVFKLLDEGGTVPFIARYRKEATGGLDEVQIRTIEERRGYLVELEERRKSILAAIAEQGKLTDELRQSILACRTKAALEDLYLPYKPKRRTRATIARERGLEPLALRILAQPPDGDVEGEAASFVDGERGVGDVAAALAGARDIVAETVAENASVRGVVREVFAREGVIAAEMHPDAAGQRNKFEQYYEFREKAADIPSHRFLAIRRGEREKALRLRLEVEAAPISERIASLVGLDPRSPFSAELRRAVEDAYERLLAPSVENDIRVELKQRSDRAAVDVFASNLRNLLLAPPLGARRVVGIDPGLRTGSKCVALEETGRFLEAVTVFVGLDEAREGRARRDLAAFVARHRPFAVAVGNGTGGREAEAFVRQLLLAEGLREIVAVQVNEAGASVYSASDVAREELPDLDLTLRGAVSIARRLQDPLAELVKIDPKAIGVGQYQHDVHQPLLQRKLDEVVESCVNMVGVELNTASVPLLGRVAGIGPSLARKIVAHRDSRGAFSARCRLLEVAGVGPRTYEQAAGFLRVHGGEHPLDVSSVHPERYGLVERMAVDLEVDLRDLVGNAELAGRIDIGRYVAGEVGEPTLRDIVEELRKPGRDPRQVFEAPQFRDDVQKIEDVREGMELEGVVTNVTAFGAFVDIGVHQDGLVHISQLSDRFVRNPHDVVQVGERLRVRVLQVDLERRRIALSARSAERGTAGGGGGDSRGGGPAVAAEADHPRGAGGTGGAGTSSTGVGTRSAGSGEAAGRDAGREEAGRQTAGQRGEGKRQRPAERRERETRGAFSNRPFANLLRRPPK